MSIPQQGGGPIERREQLAEYIAGGEKPREAWRIGTEHEKFGFTWDDLKPLPYDGPRSIRAMLEGLRDRFGWDEVREGEHLIGLQRGGANVSLEPGGQFELSGAPLETLHDTQAETVRHMAEVKSVADEMGAGFLGLGAAPVWQQDQIPMMPKGRYALMTPYMQKVGTLGTQMMYRTSTVQANLDFGSESDMVQKLRVALALQPVATALFANSPFLDGRPNGMKSWRSHIWQNLDAARTGMLPFVFEDGFGYEAWVDYVLDVPMYFVYRDGKYIDALGQSFRDFLDGRLPALPGELPTLSDWADHMTTVFPEARVKRYIEMRGADCGPLAHLTALPALWVGLIYDQGALDSASDMIRGWTHDTREGLRRAAARDGLAGEHDGIRLNDLAAEVLSVAGAGLAARGRLSADGQDESCYLAVLRDRVSRGMTAADDLLAKYHGEWQGDLSRIYAEAAY